ncbi:MAG: KdsC family phosphatase [Gammaproteobacteria bacterium]
MNERLAAVRLLALDVDGVLTDGRIWIFDRGGEAKAFHIHDGHGLKRLMAAGIVVVLITGRHSPATRRRAGELGIAAVHEGVEDKGRCLTEVAAAAGVPLAACAYMGDDEPDISALTAAGVALAPANAVPAVRALADWCATASGGRGAVREACELLLAARRV